MQHHPLSPRRRTGSTFFVLGLTLRSLWARKVRFVLTGVAVVLGVAFMAGTFVLTDTVGRSFDRLLASGNEGIDVIVQSTSATDADLGAEHERVADEVVGQIAGIDGVAAAAGTIQGFAQLVGSDGEVQGLGGMGATIGSNWIADPSLNPLDLARGRAPGPGEVVLDAATVEREGWSLGDQITVLGRGAPSTLTLVGTATFAGLDGLPGSSLVAVDDPTAQGLFGAPGSYDSIAVSASDGVAAGDLVARIERTLGDPSIDVLTGQEDTEAQQQALHDDLAFFDTFLLSFAWIALFVGTFIIRNTFAIVLAQRTKETAMLRAVGASRRQMVRSVLVEAGLLGVIASLVGLVGGIGVARALKSLLSAIGLEVPSGSIVVEPRTIVVSLVVGIGITALSAIGPALRSGRVPPVAAMREVAVDRADRSVRRTVAGIVTLVGGAALFASGVLGEGSGTIAPIGLGALLATIGVTVLGPVLVRPFTRVVGAPYPRLFGQVGRLAQGNAARSPRRTAASASALMIGVALVGFITILASSAKASVAASVDRSVRADYVVDSGAWEVGGFSPVLAGELADLPEVEAATPIRTTTVTIAGQHVALQAADTAVLDELLDLDVLEGDLADVHGDAVAVEAEEAAEHGWTAGDVVEAEFLRTGRRGLRIAAIYDEPVMTVEQGTYLVGLDTFEANVTDQYDLRVLLSISDDVTAADSQASLERALEKWPNAELQDRAAVKEQMTSEIDMILNLVYGMLALAVLIALIGIANTLGLSIHERRREIGALRAVGMDRQQVRRSVRWESVLIALLGTSLGLALALGGSWGVVHALRSEGVGSFVVPTGELALIVAIGVVAGVVAAIGPARRAARLDVLTALHA